MFLKLERGEVLMKCCGVCVLCRDLSGQWVSMRTKFEEQRAAVEQLKETLNDMQGSDGKARIADTILDLTQKLGAFSFFLMSGRGRREEAEAD